MTLPPAEDHVDEPEATSSADTAVEAAEECQRSDDAQTATAAGEADRGESSAPQPPLRQRLATFGRAIRDADDKEIEATMLRLSHRSRWLAPLALAIGAVLLLFEGVRLLFANWRLTLVQVLPAMWIWLAMFDLKIHALHGKSFHVIRGPILIPPVLAVIVITMIAFFLNAVFAFAISESKHPEIRPAFAKARHHMTPILLFGASVGALLAFSTLIVTRWGRPWFGISLGITVGLMMVSYVALPSRLIGVHPKQSRRDKLAATAVGGALSTTVCTPPYMLGRIGLLMLGSKALFIPGIFLMAIGVTLQAGATGAVRAIKMTAKLAVTREPTTEPATAEPAAPPDTAAV